MRRHSILTLRSGVQSLCEISYAALGLASTLAPAPSGGVEVTRTSKPHTAQNPAGELAQTKPTVK